MPHDILAPDGRVLLRKFSASIEHGEHVALTGPNGCGKSVLLRQIAGIGAERKSEFFIINHNRISYIPTRPQDLILPWATFAENIGLFSSITHEANDDIQQSLDIYAKRMGISLNYFRHQTIYKLSNGQQALAAIFCALIQRPKILIADEIFSALAEKPRRNIATFLREQKITIICASHDADFINTLGARCLLLDPYMV